jgi:hypothetical protein
MYQKNRNWRQDHEVTWATAQGDTASIEVEMLSSDEMLWRILKLTNSKESASWREYRLVSFINDLYSKRLQREEKKENEGG